jgi:hypothetical protein
MDQNREDYDQNGKGENPPCGARFILELIRVRCDGLKTELGNRVRGGTGGLVVGHLGSGCWAVCGEKGS